MQKLYSIVPFAITFLLLLFGGKVSSQCTEMFPKQSESAFTCYNAEIDFKVFNCTSTSGGTWSISGMDGFNGSIVTSNESVATVNTGDWDADVPKFTITYTAGGSSISQSFTLIQINGDDSPSNDINTCTEVSFDLDLDPFNDPNAEGIYHVTSDDGLVDSDRESKSSDNITNTFTNNSSSPITISYHVTLLYRDGNGNGNGNGNSVTGWDNTNKFDVTVHPGFTADASFDVVDTEVDNKSVCIGSNVVMYGFPSNPGNGEPDIYTYNWSGGDTDLYTTTDQNPVITNVNTSSFDTYNLLVTDVNFCTSSSTITLEEGTAQFTADASFDMGDTEVDTKGVCEGASVTMYGFPSNPGNGDPDIYTYSWSGGDTDLYTTTDQNPVIMNVNSSSFGEYTLEVTNISTNCTSTTTITLEEGTAQFTADASFDNGDTNVDTKGVCEGADVIMYGFPSNPSNGDPDIYTYSWSGGDTDLYNTTDQNPTIIDVNGFSFGDYTLEVTDVFTQCTSSSTITLELGTAQFTADASFDMDDSEIDEKEVCIGADVSMYGFPSNPGNGDPDIYTYSWLGGDQDLYNQSDQNPMITDVNGFSFGDYVLEVTDIATQCKSVSSIELSIGTPPNVTASFVPNDVVVNQVACDGETINMFGLPDNPVENPDFYSYSWTSNSNTPFNSTDQNPLVIASTETAGTYTLLVEDENECSSSAQISFTLQDAPTLANSSITICSGSTLDYDLSQMGTADSYTWQALDNIDVLGETTSEQTTNTIEDVLTILDQGSSVETVIYNVIGYSENGCPSNQATLEVSIQKKPEVNIDDPIPNASVCGDNIHAINSNFISVSDFSNPVWTINSGGGEITPSNTLLPSYDPLIDNPRTVELQLSVDGIGACDSEEDSDTYTIEYFKAPEVSIGDNSPSSICVSDSYTFTDVTVEGGGSILWSVDSGTGMITDATTALATYTPGPGDAGNDVTLTILVSGEGTCDGFTDEASFILTVDPLPTINAGSDLSVCEGDNVDINATGTNIDEMTIDWSEDGAGSLSPTVDDLNTTYSSDANEGGNTVIATIEVNGIDACSEETVSSSTNISVNNYPTFTTNEPICAEDRLTITLSGSYTDANSVSIEPNVGTVTFSGGNYSITGFPADEAYVLTFSDTNTGCSTTFGGSPVNCPCEGGFAVDLPIISSPLSSCFTGDASDNKEFSISNVGSNEQGRWFEENGSTPIALGDSYQPNVTNVGTYFYDVQLYNSTTDCSSDRITIAYTIHPLPVLSSEDEEICNGEVVTLSAEVDDPVNPLTWSWTGNTGAIQTANQQTTDVVGVSEDAVFTIEVTDGNTCTSSTDVNVTVNSVPDATIKLVDEDFYEYCQNADIRPNIQINLSGGEPYTFTYKKDNIETTIENYTSSEFIIENAFAGIYKLIGVNNGCDGTVSNTSIEVIENTTIPVTITGDDKVCEKGTTILTANGNYVSFEWSDGANSTSGQSNEISMPGLYVVTVTDQKGCTATDSKEIQLSEVNATIFPSEPTLYLCKGDEISLQASNENPNDSPNSYDWLDFNNENFLLKFTPAQSTIVKVEVENSYNCKDTAQTQIIVNIAEEADVTVVDSEICAQESFNININNKEEFSEVTFGSTGQYNPSTGQYSFKPNKDTTDVIVSTVDNNGCDAQVEINDLVRYRLPTLENDIEKVFVAVSQNATFDVSSFTLDERCDSDYEFVWFIDRENGENYELDEGYDVEKTKEPKLTLLADGNANDKWEIFAVLQDNCSCESSDTIRFQLDIAVSVDCEIEFTDYDSKICEQETVTIKAEGTSKFAFKEAKWLITYNDKNGIEVIEEVDENSETAYWKVETFSIEEVAGNENNSFGEISFKCKKPGEYRAEYVLNHNGCDVSSYAKVNVFSQPQMTIPVGAFPDTICYGQPISAELSFPEGDFSYNLEYTVNGEKDEFVFNDDNRQLKLDKQTMSTVNIQFNSLTSLYSDNVSCTIDDLDLSDFTVIVRDSFQYKVKKEDCVNDSISYRIEMFGGEKPYNVYVQIPGQIGEELEVLTSPYSTGYNIVGEYRFNATSQCDEENEPKPYNETCVSCLKDIKEAIPTESLLPYEDLLICTNSPSVITIDNVKTDLDKLDYLVVLQKIQASLQYNKNSVEAILDYTVKDGQIEIVLDYNYLESVVQVSPDIKYTVVIYPLSKKGNDFKEDPCEGAGFNVSFTYPPSPSINATDLIVCKNQSNVVLSHNAQNAEWIQDNSFNGEVNDFDTEDLYLNFTNVEFNDKFDFVLKETLGGCIGTDTITLKVSDNQNDIAPEVKNIYRYPGGVFVYEEDNLCYTWGVNNQGAGDFPDDVISKRYFIFNNAILNEPYDEKKHKVWVDVQYPEDSGCNSCTNRVYFNVLTPPKLGGNISNEYAVKAFPNPVSDNLVIDIKGVQFGQFVIELWSPTGQLVETKSINKKEHTLRFDYDMSKHIQGLYLMKVIDENGFSNILKVVKQ